MVWLMFLHKYALWLLNLIKCMVSTNCPFWACFKGFFCTATILNTFCATHIFYIFDKCSFGLLSCFYPFEKSLVWLSLRFWWVLKIRGQKLFNCSFFYFSFWNYVVKGLDPYWYSIVLDGLLRECLDLYFDFV